MVAAISRDREVATQISKFIGRLGGSAYVKPVQVAEPEDLHLFVLRRSDGRGEYCKGKVVPDHWYLRHDGPPWGEGSSSATDEDGGVVLPFVPPADRWRAETNYPCGGPCPSDSLSIPPSTTAVHVRERWSQRVTCARD